MSNTTIKQNISNITISQNQNILYILEDKNIEDKIDIYIEPDIHTNISIININSHLNIQIYHQSGATSNIKNINISKNKTSHISITSTLSGDHSTSNVYMRSILNKGADIYADGYIDITQNVTNVSGHLTEENILCGGHRKLRVRPILDVKSNQVSASHACKISRISDDKIFYMMSKGLSKNISYHMIIDSYISRVLDIGDPVDTEQIYHHISQCIVI